MSFVVPTRAQLLKLYGKAERYGRWWFFFDIALLGMAMFYLRIDRLRAEPVEAAVIIGLSAGPTLLSLAYHFAQKMKAVQNLREDIVFGKITKSDLLAVMADVFQKMKIPPGDITVYVTAEKGVNAGALAVGLGWLMPALRGVYLNRATIHALGKEELGTVLAHELAHIYRYPLYYQKGLFLHLITSAAIAIGLWSQGYHLMLALVAIGAYYFCLNVLFGRYSRVVEHLCDDCGAEVIGVEAALRAEFLVAEHSSIVSRAYQVALERKLDGQGISQRDIQSIIEDSLSFDPPKAEELEREVIKRLEHRAEKSNNSFFHFAMGLITSDGPDANAKLAERLEDLRRANRATALELPKGEGLTKEWFAELVGKIEAEPEKVLFPVPEELSDAESSHPSPRKRIVYLWENFVRNPG